MRLYIPSSEETLRARKLLRDWAGEGLLTEMQREVLDQETVPDLRTTNIYLRVVLFFFTLIIVGAGAGLFFAVFLPHAEVQTVGIFFLIFAGVCYAAAEVAVSQARLYRYGVEEALAVCSVGFLCGGMLAALFLGSSYSLKRDVAQCVVPLAGALFSLWIWLRFGFSYAFLAAMIFAVFLPGYWTASHSAQHMIVAAFYAAGLAGVATVRSRHRSDYLDEGYSLVEALLWIGIYLAINLQLSSLSLLDHWWGGFRVTSEFARPFYWTTWVLIWCLPPVMLVRGVRRKDRSVITAGVIAAVLTFVSNKPYLGWPRHTWDPMLLGILLTGVAVFVRRWLAGGAGGVRHGFTAARLSGQDKEWMSIGSTALGLLTPSSITPAPQATSPDFRFGGGHSGGGGASSNF